MIKSVGFILLSIYLILVGLAHVAALAIPGIILGIIAILAGIFILLGK